MFIPEEMIQIQIVFSRADINAVTTSVVRQGILQIVDPADMESWAQELPKAGTGEEADEMRTRRERVDAAIKEMDLSVGLKGVKPAEWVWEKIDERLAAVETEIRKERQIREEITKELGRLDQLRLRVSDIPVLGFSLEGREAYSYLFVEIGKVADKNMSILHDRLEPILHFLSVLSASRGMTTFLVVSLKKDQDALTSALREAGFEPLDIDKEEFLYSPEKIRELDQESKKLKDNLIRSEERINQIGHKQDLFLRSVLFRIRRENLEHTILKYFRKTDQTYFLTGWVPLQDRDRLYHDIQKATQNRCIIKDQRAEEMAGVLEGKIGVPVRLKNPWWIKPFELLTLAYGVPEYRTLDPTPLVGLSFLLMFGMMFGDVGHGLVIALIGAMIFIKGKKGTGRDAGLLVLYAGCSSIIFGFLFGSVFGFEESLPTLWIKPMESISTMFKVVIYFGTGLITTAIALRIINKIRKKNFLGVFFDKAGVIGLILYWCGIFLAGRVIGTKTEGGGGSSSILIVLMAAAGLLLFFQEPIVHLLQGKRKLYPEGVAGGIVGGIVELLEVFLGFLANTVSFIRVAAFGLAHVGLFMAVFALSEATRGASSIVIQLVGNIVIIGLEGLVVSIQCVRLEFYEFFSRFFEQGEMGYSPVGEELIALKGD